VKQSHAMSYDDITRHYTRTAHGMHSTLRRLSMRVAKNLNFNYVCNASCSSAQVCTHSANLCPVTQRRFDRQFGQPLRLQRRAVYSQLCMMVHHICPCGSCGRPHRTWSALQQSWRWRASPVPPRHRRGPGTQWRDRSSARLRRPSYVCLFLFCVCDVYG